MAFTVSICDDDPSQITYLRSLLSEWSADKPFALMISEYESAEGFLFAYPDNPCELLLLDIEMKQLNGMELAKRLRAEGDMLPIVFITGFSEYLSDGYDVEALHYLLKPVDKAKLYGVLDRYVKRQGVRTEEILLSGEGRIRHVSLESIVYIEARGRKTELHLADGTVFESDRSIGDWERQTASAFIHTHRSYMVNLRYIQSIGRTECILDSGESVPLSRRLYQEVNERFIGFYLG